MNRMHRIASALALALFSQISPATAGDLAPTFGIVRLSSPSGNGGGGAVDLLLLVVLALILAFAKMKRRG
jgi:hypothetical protein